MSNVYITDDGDEVVFIKVEEDVIAEVSHDAYGWAGMQQVIKLVEDLAETFGIEVYNSQAIV